MPPTRRADVARPPGDADPSWRRARHSSVPGASGSAAGRRVCPFPCEPGGRGRYLFFAWTRTRCSAYHASKDSQERTTEVHLRAERLSFSDDDVRSEVPWGTHDRLRDRIHPDDEHPFRHGANFLELFFESAEEIRVLDVDAAYVRWKRGLQLREVEHPALPVVVHFADLEACADNVVREHRPSVVPQRTRDEEDPTPVDSVRHPGRFAERRRAVVHRRVRRVHPGELADQALILPERLEQALTDLGLVRRVRGVELGAGDDSPHAGGHETIVQTPPRKRRHFGNPSGGPRPSMHPP